jgi:DNA-binding HxlR family transcriptional regulator
MKRISFDEMSCSVAQALEVVGEWWTLLIVRDVSLGLRRFDEIQEDLGISRNVLTDRLNKLVDEEILYRTNIAASGTRYDYRLTDKGLDLIPVLLALMAWGDRWVEQTDGPYTQIVHTACGHVTRPGLICSHCGETIPLDELRSRPGPAFTDDPGHPINRARRARGRAAEGEPAGA